MEMHIILRKVINHTYVNNYVDRKIHFAKQFAIESTTNYARVNLCFKYLMARQTLIELRYTQ